MSPLRARWPLLTLAVALHLYAVGSIAAQPLGAPPGAAPVRWLFNGGVHRVGPGADFFALYWAGVHHRAGHSVYEAARIEGHPPYTFPYRYAPIVAQTLGVALTALSPQAAYRLWVLLLELLLLAALLAWWTRSRSEPWRTGGCLAMLLSTPYWLEVQMGQFTFASSALAFLALLLAERPARGAAGRLGPPLLLGAAGLLKTYPLVVLPGFFRRRPVAAVVVFGALALLAWIGWRADPAEWATFASRNFVAARLSASDAGNHGLLHTLAQWGHSLGAPGAHETLSDAARGFQIVLLGAPVALALVAPRRLAALLGGTLLLGHFLSYPHVWEHHHSAVLLGGLLIARRGASPKLAAAMILLLALPTPFALLDVAKDPEVWNPAEAWPPATQALVAMSKSGPTLLLYLIGLFTALRASLEGRGLSPLTRWRRLRGGPGGGDGSDPP